MSRRLRQILWAALAAGAAAALLAAVAWAHAELLDAAPAAGSSVSPSPAEIRLTFSETLVDGSRITLFGNKFQAVANVTTIVAGSQMRGLLGATLPPAAYTVQWSAISLDGHTVSGSYPFSVAAAAPASPRSLTGLVAALAVIIGGGSAVLILFLNRRSRI